jgi:hypothetical protein
MVVVLDVSQRGEEALERIRKHSSITRLLFARRFHPSHTLARTI